MAACVVAVAACLPSAALRAQTAVAGGQREVRAVWLTTIGGLDWPASYAHTPSGIERQKQQLCQHLDRLREIGVNRVLLQTRIRGTVIYPSALEPWDGCLSGRPGMSPGYDALQFAVAECHRRGMAIEAWVVAFPLTNFAVTRQLGRQSVVSRHPEMCLRAGDHWMMDPGVPATGHYLARLCAEIAENYDVDGIHLDYVRYPEKEIPFNDARTYRRYGRGEGRAAWRRANVTRVVSEIYSAVKAVKPWVAVSCSPVGKHDDLPRYFSYGWNARTTVAQDVQEWMRLGIMDEIFPMMYFRGNNFYPFALDWVESSGGRIVAPGLGVYFLDEGQKDWPLETITRELNFLRLIGADGHAYFRSRFLENNVKGIADFLKHSYYTAPSLQPAMPWLDSIAPTAPARARADRGRYEWKLTWLPSSDPTPGDTLRYNIYAYADSLPRSLAGARLIASRIAATSCAVDVACPASRRMGYAVTAIDRFGNESAPAVCAAPAASAPAAGTVAAGLRVDSGRIDVSALGMRLAMIRDAEGRELRVVECTGGSVDVSRLAPGAYRLYVRGRRGGEHFAGMFMIEP